MSLLPFYRSPKLTQIHHISLTWCLQRKGGVVKQISEQLDVLLRLAADLHRVQDLGQSALFRVGHVDEFLPNFLLKIFRKTRGKFVLKMGKIGQ